MKSLYKKASYLWSTLAGLNLEKQDPNINKVLEENRPALADSETVSLTKEELEVFADYAEQVKYDVGFYESQLDGVQDYLQERQDNEKLTELELSLLTKLNNF